jgi:hypothetical protein
MHRLQEFTIGAIVPEWDKLMNHSRKDESELPMMTLLTIEALLWLHLGVELGAFPRRTGEDVSRFYYAPFFKWLDSYNRATEQARIGPPFLESASYLSLPEFARVLVRKGINQNLSLDDQPSGVGERNGMIAPFQSLLILYSLLRRDAAVRRFLYGIGFQSPDEWREQWSRACTAEDLFKAVESEEASPVAMVLAGYMRFCEYARNTNDVLDNIEGLGILDRPRFFEFKDRVRSMQAWRLNLSSGATAKRFEQVRERVSDMIARELTNLKLKDEVERAQRLLEKSLNLLFDLEPVTVQ